LFTVLLSWGSSIISISPLLAGENDQRAKLTELLFKAVKTNNINAVRAAIEAGAELSRINLNGQTALDIAISNNHFKIANFLVFARRIEQQAILKSAPTFNSVQQASPEAAPVVNISADNLSESQQPEPKTNFLTTIIKQKAKKEPKPSPIKQNSIATKNFNTKDQTVTAISNTKSQAPQQKLQTVSSYSGQEKLDGTLQNKTKKELNSSKSVFFMDAGGNLIKSSVAEIKRVQKTIRQNAARLLPDIEPRKSLFIPKPRLKPSFSPPMASQLTPNPQNQAPKVETKLNNTAPKTSKSKSFKNQLSNVQKTSNSQKAKSKMTKTDYIRTTRRISPELLNKLRRGLEETKRQQKISAGGTAKIAVKKINLPGTARPKQKKKPQTTPLPPLKVPTRAPLTVAPKLQLNDKTRIEKSESEKKNIFGKFFSNLTNFLGVTNASKEAKKKANPIGDEAQTRILFQHSKNSKPRARKIQTIDQPIRKRSSTQLSLTLEPRKYETPNPKLEPVEENKAAKNNPTGQLRKKNDQTKLELNKKNITQRGQNTNKNIKSDATFNTMANQTTFYQLEKKNSNTTIRQPKVYMPLTRLRKPLKNISLTLGNSVTTGQSKLPHGIAEPDPCIQKRRGKISFCIVPIDWPQKIENAFSINTSLYQGTRAIVRYDKGKATHFHVLYKSAVQDKIINFIKQRYGPPTEMWKRVISPFGKPRQSNPTFVWRSHDIKLNKVTILEIRKFDDSRTVFPDTKHGAIRLYIAGGPPVFPIVTAHDIMSIDWAARSDHHLDNDLPALARTIRVQP